MKKFTPFVLIIVVLILALAALGVGYGLWYENLDITGSVTTGTVNVEWSGPYNSTGGDGWDECVHLNGYPGACTPEGVTIGGKEAKDVADCKVTNDGTNFSIEVDNAYPSYQCSFDLDIHSLGSIPVHLAVQENTPAPAWMDNPDDEFDCSFFDVSTGQTTHIGSLADLYNPDTPVQLHFGDEVQCSVIIHFTNTDDVEQDRTGSNSYQFSYTIQAHQYNEDANFSLP